MQPLLRCCVSWSQLNRILSQRIQTRLISSSESKRNNLSLPGNPIADRIALQREGKEQSWSDYFFEDGWRRPLAKDQGGKPRADWVWFGYMQDEYEDWKLNHATMFHFFFFWYALFLYCCLYRSDWPDLKEWAMREAYIEIAKREKFGHPYISMDLVPREKMEQYLPSEEELGDFRIVI